MKKAKKILTLVACAVLLVCISVGATIAYLQAQDTVTNTFTVGDIKIKLDEAEIKDYNAETNRYDAVDDSTKRVEANTYKMTPGIYMAKDPTVTVETGSDRAYIRALVTIEYLSAADSVIPADFFTAWVQGYDQSTWMPANMTVTKDDKDTEATTDDITTRTYELRYKEMVNALEATEDVVLTDIFTGIQLPATLSNEDMATLADMKITVVAHAIQADGFENAAAAWDAWGAPAQGGDAENGAEEGEENA